MKRMALVAPMCPVADDVEELRAFVERGLHLSYSPNVYPYSDTTLHALAAAGFTACVAAVLRGDLGHKISGAPGSRVGCVDKAWIWKDARRADPMHSSVADIEAKGAMGRTPLATAVAKGRLEVAELFVKAGANPETVDEHGRNLLCIAAAHGHLHVVQWLCSAVGFSRLVDPSSRRSLHYRSSVGMLALHYAARGGFTAIVDTLWRFGACEADAQSAQDANVFHYLAEACPGGGMAKLVAGWPAGLAVHSRRFGGTPLHVAARRANAAFIELALKHGAELEARDMEGNTPFFVAVKRGNMACVRLLVAAGVDVNARTHDGYTALAHLASWYHGCEELLPYLLTLPELDLGPCNTGNTGLRLAQWLDPHSLSARMVAAEDAARLRWSVLRSAWSGACALGACAREPVVDE